MRAFPLLSYLALGACGSVQGSSAPPDPRLEGCDPELSQAVEAARGRVLAHPDELAARVEFAMTLDANELDTNAEEAWLQVCALDARDAHAYYHLARVRERRGDASGALEAVRRALVLAPDYAPAHARAGRLWLESGELDAAEHALLAAVELDRELPAACLSLARLHLLREHVDEAIRVLDPLLRKNPREPYVHALLARAFTMKGDALQARQHLLAEEAAGPSAGHDPWQAEVQRRACGLGARIDRSKARLAAGDPGSAWSELAPLEARANELPVLDAQCQVLMALGKPAEVLQRIERAAPALRSSALVVLDHALALRALGELERSLGEVEREARRNPADPRLHALEGELCFALERYPQAVAACVEARERGEHGLANALFLARARAQNGDLDGGLRELEAAARDFPFAPKPWAYRSEFLALAGRRDEARASLDEAKKRGLEPALIQVVSARLDEIEHGEEPGR